MNAAPPPRRAQISTMLEMLPPFALRVAATLGLTDRLIAGISTVEELAAATGTDPDALRRLLRYLARLQVYREDEAGGFSVTAAGRLLGMDHPAGLAGWLDLESAGGRMDMALAGLLHAVRTGRSGYEAVFGRPFWAELADDSGLSRSFDELMAAKSARVAAELAEHVDFTGVREVADIGGGVGITLSIILRAHHGLDGCLVEQQNTAETARGRLADDGLADRCRIVAGSFLTEVPQGADLYLLFDILHDWDDHTALMILRNCAAAAEQGARVLVVEQLTQAPLDREGAAMDLKMLVLFGGRQRSAAQLAELATEAGLRGGDVQLLPSGFSAFQCTVGPPAVSVGKDSLFS